MITTLLLFISLHHFHTTASKTLYHVLTILINQAEYNLAEMVPPSHIFSLTGFFFMLRVCSIRVGVPSHRVAYTFARAAGVHHDAAMAKDVLG